MDSTVATTTQRGTHNDSDQLEELDIDSILRRSRNLGRTRRRKPMCEAPEFVQRLNPFNEVEVGDNIVFECQCISFPNATIKWYKDDIEISDNHRMSMTSDNKGVIRMAIENSTKDDEGTYRCKAENEEGIASTTGYVTITGDDPEKPLSSQSRDRNPDHVSLPPHLRTIQEQKTLEDSETVEYGKMSPSPIRAFNEGRRIRKKSIPSSEEDSAISDTDSDNTSVDSQDFNHVMEDLTLDLADAEHHSSCHSSPTHTNMEDHYNEHNLENQPLQADDANNTKKHFSGNQKDRVPSAQALSSMFKTFVGEDVTYSINEIDMNEKAYIETKQSAGEGTNSLSPLSPEHKTSSIDSGYNGMIPTKDHPGDLPESSVTNALHTQTIAPLNMPLPLEDDIIDFPWLFYTGFVSAATFIATYTDMSPVLFVVLVTVFSFLSFGTMVKCKPVERKD